MDKIPDLPEDQWPEIRLAKANARIGWLYFAELVKSMQSELGVDKAAEVIEKWAAKIGEKFVVPAMKGFGIEGKDAWSVASYFKIAVGNICGYKTELSRNEDNVVILKVFAPCLWFPDLDISPKICRALEYCEKAAASTLNPNIEVEPIKLMTDGDDYCELHFIEKG